ncbi:hypothetical protein KU6B_07610 [Mameliella alba]|uniref:hypothetical protein n=1 Tax=Mameliella alba TaxID=561184 RepID=UPI0013E4AEBF|nr:hypothetical protein [Mameliella alba]BBU54496.1 hypothetical protein KU6B_07610 [Mameliella alba]
MKPAPIALAALGLATPALGQSYACAPWGAASDTAPIAAITVSQRMITIEQGGLKTTARMAQATLKRRVFLAEDAALVVYGDAVLNAGQPPAFGDHVTLQHLRYDATAPNLAQTACERLK